MCVHIIAHQPCLRVHIQLVARTKLNIYDKFKHKVLHTFSCNPHTYLLVPTQMRQQVLWMAPQLYLRPWPTVLQDLQALGLSMELSQKWWIASRQMTCAIRTLTAALGTG